MQFRQKNKKILGVLGVIIFLSGFVFLASNFLDVSKIVEASPFDIQYNPLGRGIDEGRVCEDPATDCMEDIVINRESELVLNGSSCAEDGFSGYTYNCGSSVCSLTVGAKDGVCPSTACTYRDDVDCGCNSISYDGQCNRDIGCNRDNDLDCRREDELPPDTDIITDGPRIVIEHPTVGETFMNWSNIPVLPVFKVDCYDDSMSSWIICDGDSDNYDFYLTEVGVGETCPTDMEDFGVEITTVDFGSYSAEYYKAQSNESINHHSYWCGGVDVTSGNGFGKARKIEIRVDTQDPRVAAFDSPQRTEAGVLPVCGSGGIEGRDDKVRLNWSVGDEGGSGIDKIEVWEADLKDDGTCEVSSWDKVSRGSPAEEIILSSSEISWIDRDIDMTGIGGDVIGKCYGIHVLDKAGNCVIEDGNSCGPITGDPVKVEIVDCNPQTLKLSKVTTGIPVTDNFIYGGARVSGYKTSATDVDETIFDTSVCRSPSCGCLNDACGTLFDYPEEAGPFRTGTQATIEPIETPDAEFAYWTGVEASECDNWNATESWCLDEKIDQIEIGTLSRTIVAHFVPIKHDLSIDLSSAYPNNSVDISFEHPLGYADKPEDKVGLDSSSSYGEKIRNRTTVILKANADDTAVFSHWEIDYDYDGSFVVDEKLDQENARSNEITGDVMIKPVFDKLHCLCYKAIGDGTVSQSSVRNSDGYVLPNFADEDEVGLELVEKYKDVCSSCSDQKAIYQNGAKISMMALGSATGDFDVWNSGYCDGESDPNCLFEMNNSYDIEAIFKKIITLYIDYPHTTDSSGNWLMDFGLNSFDFSATEVRGGSDVNITDENLAASPGDGCDPPRCYKYAVGSSGIKLNIDDIDLKSGWRVSDWSRNFAHSIDDNNFERSGSCDETWADNHCLKVGINFPNNWFINTNPDFSDDSEIARLKFETQKIYELSVSKTGPGADDSQIQLSGYVIDESGDSHTTTDNNGDSYTWPSSDGDVTGDNEIMRIYDHGEIAEVKVMPGSGVDVKGWYQGGTFLSSCGTNTECEVAMDSDTELEVRLGRSHQMTLGFDFAPIAANPASYGNPKINATQFSTPESCEYFAAPCIHDFLEGVSGDNSYKLDVEAENDPSSEWKFDSWSGDYNEDNGCNYDSTVCGFDYGITGDRILTAKFTEQVWPVVNSFNLTSGFCFDGSGTVSFSGTVSDLGTGIDGGAELFYSNDGGTNWTDTSVKDNSCDGVIGSCGFNLNYDISSLSPGSYLFGVHVNDGAGHCSTESNEDCASSSPAGGDVERVEICDRVTERCESGSCVSRGAITVSGNFEVTSSGNQLEVIADRGFTQIFNSGSVNQTFNFGDSLELLLKAKYNTYDYWPDASSFETKCTRLGGRFYGGDFSDLTYIKHVCQFDDIAVGDIDFEFTDQVWPVIEEFKVDGTAGSGTDVDVCVSDGDDIELYAKGIEIGRGNSNISTKVEFYYNNIATPGGWSLADHRYITHSANVSFDYSSRFSSSILSAGDYMFGTHFVDTAGNSISESREDCSGSGCDPLSLPDDFPRKYNNLNTVKVRVCEADEMCNGNNECVTRERIVFVTGEVDSSLVSGSLTYFGTTTGDISYDGKTGIKAADEICNVLAKNGSEINSNHNPSITGRTYKAWLGDTSKDPFKDWDTSENTIYVNTNYETLVDGWSNFISNPSVKIEYDQNGNNITTGGSGITAVCNNLISVDTVDNSNNCNNWRSDLTTYTGLIGRTSTGIYGTSDYPCSSYCRLYCVEQVE